MNWGLFLALAGFLLPLSLALRLAVDCLDPGAALRRLRVAQLLLVAVPICGKMPGVVFALTGGERELGEAAEALMVTGWGFAQITVLVLAVAFAEWGSPNVSAGLGPGAPVAAAARTYRARHAAIVLICLLLAWVGAR